MTDQSEFKKTIEVVSDKRNSATSFHIWVDTLPIEEIQEWQRVHQIHESVVNQAILNGDATRVYDNNNCVIQICWKNEETHLAYVEQMTDHDIYLSFWHRYRETLK